MVRGGRGGPPPIGSVAGSTVEAAPVDNQSNRISAWTASFINKLRRQYFALKMFSRKVLYVLVRFHRSLYFSVKVSNVLMPQHLC